MIALESPANVSGRAASLARAERPLAIAVDGVGKMYRIRHQQAGRYRTLSEEITTAVSRQLRRWTGRATPADQTRQVWEDFWALKDVAYEVMRGDVVGIIGRNGAGKSTMLKILSRITAPTEGRLRIRGRLASLLEVGTGFHPELTGRENIFLNGAVLGMTKRETLAKFDEIVAFAEATTFLDTPVKFYSSGMYMRLAFAVAAHLEPEILVVDEVLAVGDMGFQKKCLGKMQGVASSGRTVLFVSHNMQAVRTLCTRGILLDKGRVILDSTPQACTQKYNELARESEFTAQTATWDSRFRRGSGAVRFTEIRALDQYGAECYQFKNSETVRFSLGYEVNQQVAECFVSVGVLCGQTGRIVTSTFHRLPGDALAAGARGHVVIEWPQSRLRPGEYPLYLWLGDSRFQPFDIVERITAPLTITAEGEPIDLGYDPAQFGGYFDMPANMSVVTGAAE